VPRLLATSLPTLAPQVLTWLTHPTLPLPHHTVRPWVATRLADVIRPHRPRSRLLERPRPRALLSRGAHHGQDRGVPELTVARQGKAASSPSRPAGDGPGQRVREAPRASARPPAEGPVLDPSDTAVPYSIGEEHRR